jgi:hypothetical protein
MGGACCRCYTATWETAAPHNSIIRLGGLLGTVLGYAFNPADGVVPNDFWLLATGFNEALVKQYQSLANSPILRIPQLRRQPSRGDELKIQKRFFASLFRLDVAELLRFTELDFRGKPLPDPVAPPSDSETRDRHHLTLLHTLSVNPIPPSIRAAYSAFKGGFGYLDLSWFPNLTRIAENFFTDSIQCIHLPPTLTAIGPSFLAKGKGIRRLQMEQANCLKIIGSDFAVDSELQELTLPSSVETIGDFFLCETTDLTSLDLSNLSNLHSAGDAFLAYCRVKNVQFPPLLQSVGDNFMTRCPDLVDLNLSNTALRQVGVFFCAENELSRITFPDTLTALGDSFLASTIVDLVNLSTTEIKTIGANFLHQTVCSEVLLPPTLERIGVFAFSVCGPRLTKLDLSGTKIVTLPDQFACSSFLVDILFPPTLEVIENRFLFGNDSIQRLDLSQTKVRSVGRAFAAKCVRLSVLILPSTLQVVGNGFAKGCTSLRNLDLSHTCLVKVGADFGKGCPLSDLKLPETERLLMIPTNMEFNNLCEMKF